MRAYNQNCVISANTFIEIEDGGAVGAIHVVGDQWGERENDNNTLIFNNYIWSGLPGLAAGGPVCVFLGEGTERNFVMEFLFPWGTTAEDQIWDEGDNDVFWWSW